jgi:hypothetical protein
MARENTLSSDELYVEHSVDSAMDEDERTLHDYSSLSEGMTSFCLPAHAR